VTATAIQVGQTARATIFETATSGDAQIATVTPATVRIYPVKVSCPARIKTAIKLFISANVLLLAAGLDIVVAIIVTF